MTERENDGLTMVETINRALREAMEADDDVRPIGRDVGVDGGVFRVTDGLLAESGIAGVSIGMAVNGPGPVAEMQFSGFSDYALAQIGNHAARRG